MPRKQLDERHGSQQGVLRRHTMRQCQPTERQKDVSPCGCASFYDIDYTRLCPSRGRHPTQEQRRRGQRLLT